MIDPRIAVLRAALRLVLAMLKGTDKAHLIVDVGRPRCGLAQYIRRVLEDTRP